MSQVEIFVPLKNNNKKDFSSALFQHVEKELVEHFGGLTAFLQYLGKGCGRKRQTK